MPRRWSTQTRAWAYRFLALRDEEECALCQKAPPAVPLDIDHLNGDPHNNDPSNLRLLCRSCNVARANVARTNPARLHEMPDSIPSVPGYERETAAWNHAVGTEIAREAVDYQAGSQEMRANDLYEMPYRAWLLNQVRQRGFLTVQEATASGAEVVGCATVTASRYLAKLTSQAGPLQETRDILHTRVITFKEVKPHEPPTLVPQKPEEPATEQGTPAAPCQAPQEADTPDPDGELRRCAWSQQPHQHDLATGACLTEDLTYHTFEEGP